MLEGLNTLVLSHNLITNLPSPFPCKNLKKLSASYNEITDIPEFLSSILELRFSHNKITNLPKSSQASLKVLDIGNNSFGKTELKNLISYAPFIENLSVKDTELAACSTAIVEKLPTLKILDGERFDKHFLRRREKRKVKTELAAAGKKHSIEQATIVTEESKACKETEKIVLETPANTTLSIERQTKSDLASSISSMKSGVVRVIEKKKVAKVADIDEIIKSVTPASSLIGTGLAPGWD